MDDRLYLIGTPEEKITACLKADGTLLDTSDDTVNTYCSVQDMLMPVFFRDLGWEYVTVKENCGL